MEDLSFTVINNDGVEVKCDILSVMKDDNNRIFILYTDYLLDSNDKFRLLASEVVQKDKNFILEDINDDAILDVLLKSAKDIYKKNP